VKITIPATFEHNGTTFALAERRDGRKHRGNCEVCGDRHFGNGPVYAADRKTAHVSCAALARQGKPVARVNVAAVLPNPPRSCGCCGVPLPESVPSIIVGSLRACSYSCQHAMAMARHGVAP